MAPASPDVRRHTSCPTCHALFRTQPKRCPLDGAVLESTEVDPLIGRVIGDRYQIEAVIGEGGIGRVYRARHTRISRQYAIKIPFGELAFDQAIRRRLANEAEAASRVQHPNLVGVVDVGETEAGLFYLAMDLVQGSTLSSVLAGGALAPARALTVVAQIADGLGHAHARDLVHRDLKPDNIILERDPDGQERARLVDFGIALVQDAAHQRLTAQGMVIGTPEYMAPEQLTGAPIDGRTDLFALGLVLYELVTGVTPFEGSPLEIATSNLTTDLPPMADRSLAGPVDPRIEKLVRRMTAREPARRPANAELIADEARAIASTLPGGAPVPRRRKPITFTPLAADAAPASTPTPTAEAWSPIVVPSTGERRAPGGGGAVRSAVTGDESARTAATIRTPSVPAPAHRAPRALGSAPPPSGGDVAEVPEEAWPALAPAPEVALEEADSFALVPAWRRPRVLAAIATGAAVVIGALAMATC